MTSHRTRYIKRIAAATALALAVAGPAVVTTTAHAQKKLIDVTFSLDFIVLGRHAPWYVALEKGFYKEEGLNVKIIPGRGSAQVMQAVQSGLANIGFVDVPGVALARAAGSTIKIVAVMYQKAPYAIFTAEARRGGDQRQTARRPDPW